jgi:hypothetical protein
MQRKAISNLGRDETEFLEKQKATFEYIFLIKKNKLKLEYVKNQLIENLGMNKANSHIWSWNKIKYTSVFICRELRKEKDILKSAEKDEDINTEALATISDLKTDVNQSYKWNKGSNSNRIINLFEEKHEAMVAKAKKVVDELQKKYKGSMNRRKLFQNKKRIDALNIISSDLNKRKTIMDNWFDSKLMQHKEITSLEKLKTSRFANLQRSKIVLIVDHLVGKTASSPVPLASKKLIYDKSKSK